MMAENPSTLWAKIFVEELARAGLRAVVIAPGSRSTPLTLAFAAEARIRVYSLLDERSAAFFALGLALAGDEPVALVCTSGTATANFFPAIVEASQSNVPLLVLTADRPPELRHSGANQTIDQIKLYGDHVRWFVDVALPEADPPARAVRALRTLAARALAVAAGSPTPPGPVHLNFPFRKPLEPAAVPAEAPDTPALSVPPAGTHISRGVVSPTEAQLDRLAAACQKAGRGLIVCGPRCPGGDFPAAVARLARITGFPLLADALSGVRFGPHLGPEGGPPHVLAGYDTFLPAAMAGDWPRPDLVLRFGAMPTSKVLGDYLEGLAAGCLQIAVDRYGVWADAGHNLSEFVWADPASTCRGVADRLQAVASPAAWPGEAWASLWQRAETESWAAIETARAGSFFEGAVLPEVVDLLPAGALLYVASSLPVRHLDQFVPPRPLPLRVFANRGASGIDGTVSSALGAAAASGSPLALVTGDLAFYHDLNGLLALRRCGVKATIVLINNDGGGIFHRLPVARFDPPFTDLFLTPHGLDFEPAVRMFGAGYERVTTRTTFRTALQKAIGADAAQVIEVPSDSLWHEQQRREIVATVAARLSGQ